MQQVLSKCQLASTKESYADPEAVVSAPGDQQSGPGMLPFLGQARGWRHWGRTASPLLSHL